MCSVCSSGVSILKYFPRDFNIQPTLRAVDKRAGLGCPNSEGAEKVWIAAEVKEPLRNIIF